MGSIEVGYSERAHVQLHAAELIRELLFADLTFEEIAVQMTPHMSGVVPRARTVEGWAQEVAVPNKAHGAALAQLYRAKFGRPFIDAEGLTVKVNARLEGKGQDD